MEYVALRSGKVPSLHLGTGTTAHARRSEQGIAMASDVGDVLSAEARLDDAIKQATYRGVMEDCAWDRMSDAVAAGSTTMAACMAEVELSLVAPQRAVDVPLECKRTELMLGLRKSFEVLRTS